MYTLRYSSVDGYSRTFSTKSLDKARAFAQDWVGDAPDLGSTYAVSFDGIGKIEAVGISLKELFPRLG